MYWHISSASKRKSRIRQDIAISGHISEFHEAEEGFPFATHKRKNNPLEKRNRYLNEMIKKLCGNSRCINIGHDSRLFYDLIIHADYLQMKTEIIDFFYLQLCHYFIRARIFDDIIQQLERLEMVHYLKKNLVKGLMDSCKLSVVVTNDASNHAKQNTEIWDSVEITGIEDINITKSVLKSTDPPLKTRTARCLKLLLRLCHFKGLILDGCQLNEKNTIIFSEEFRIERLSLAKCGTFVNVLIQENLCGIMDHLNDLDISNNSVTNATLEKLRCYPLKSLRMSNCTSNDLDIGLLWKDGVLKDHIQTFIVGS